MTVLTRRPRRRGVFRILFSLLAWLLVLAVAGVGALWYFGPALIAPVVDFPQGPGGVVAYIGLSNQLRSQTVPFLAGQDVRLTMNEEEFSGMVGSAVLSGKQQENPVRKVRAYLPEGQIQVDMILELPYEQIPQHYRNRPVGLTVDLQPEVSAAGEVQFLITRARLGRIPVPVEAIKWAGERVPFSHPSFDAKAATIKLPVGDLIAGNFGRNIRIKQFTSSQSKLTLVMAMARSK